MQLTPTQWQETLQKIYRRAASDAAFRQRCLKDPQGVVREIGGAEPPVGTTFRFTEKSDENVFVLPPLGASGPELGETELAAVAGGVPGGGKGDTAPGCNNYNNVMTCAGQNTYA